MASATKTFITDKTVQLAVALYRLQLRAVAWRSRYYFKCFINNQIACSLEIWIKITGGAPVDFNSKLYQEIVETVEYYTYRLFNKRKAPTFLEKIILGHEFIIAERTTSLNKKRLFRFVLKHRLARFLRNHENINAYIAYVACTSISKLDLDPEYGKSAEYWRSLYRQDKIPPSLVSPPHNFLLRRLRRAAQQIKSEISQRNLLKLNFSASDISTFAALSGSLLLILGYLRVSILCWYFEIPNEYYFSASDYLANSIASVQNYFLSAAFTIAIFWFFGVASVNSYSVQEREWERNSISSRITRWAYRFLLISSLASLFYLGYRRDYFNAIQPAYLLALFGTFAAIGFLAKMFFFNPLRFYLYSSFVAMCVLSSLHGTTREIVDIITLKDGTRVRKIEFDDGTYYEPSWRIIAITSSFVILRNRADGTVLARSIDNLKGITESSPAP